MYVRTKARAPRRVCPDEYALLCAWLLVINRVGYRDVRMLAVLAVDDFGATARCIECLDCQPPGQDVITITAVVGHRRQPGRHRFSLAPTAVEVCL